MNKSEIIIYQTEDGVTKIQTRLENETVWLNRLQLSELFNRDIKTIGKHINNVFNEGELSKTSTVAKFATVQIEGEREVERNIEYYNLDVIISVGYRVKSQQGVRFRKWATYLLKQHLIKGYTVNKDVIEHNKQEFLQTIEDLKLLTNHTEVAPKDLLSLIQSFSDTFFTLEQFDKNQFPKQTTQKQIKVSAKDLQQDLAILKQELILKKEATELFALEKKQGSLEGIFKNVFQTVFFQDAYPSIEEKAANLLYFVVKNHPFNDGNKRSGAFSLVTTKN